MVYNNRLIIAESTERRDSEPKTYPVIRKKLNPFAELTVAQHKKRACVINTADWKTFVQLNL